MAIDKTLPKEVRDVIEKKFNNYKICRKCAKRNPESSTHCRKCGNSTEDYTEGNWYRRKAMEPRG